MIESNKKLHFASNLISLILSGEKFNTWRIDDDKNLAAGEIVACLESDTEKHFATISIIKTYIKPIGQLTKIDKLGHEVFENDEQMYKTYSQYYQQQVTPETLIKIIFFEKI